LLKFSSRQAIKLRKTLGKIRIEEPLKSKSEKKKTEKLSDTELTDAPTIGLSDESSRMIQR